MLEDIMLEDGGLSTPLQVLGWYILTFGLMFTSFFLDN